MKTKLLRIFLAASMLCMLLTACNNESANEQTDSQPQTDISVGSEATGEPVTLLSDGSVTMLCLDEGWKVRADPNSEGLTGEWYKEAEPVGTDISIPGNMWDVTSYAREGWFSVAFDAADLQVSSDQRVYLELNGTGYISKVWLNGEEVGSHTGANSSYSLDVTDAIRYDESNTLCIYSSYTESGPYLTSCPQIAHPVYLYVKPDVSIADTYVLTSTEDGTVDMVVTLNNAGDHEVEAVLGAKISEDNKSMVVDSESAVITVPVGESTHEITLQVEDFKYWSPDDPQLYMVSAQITAGGRTDEDTVRTGYKDLRVDDEGYFQLNGERFWIKCTHTGNYQTSSYQNASDLETYYDQLIYLKTCGFNTIRFIEGSVYTEILEMCDEIGLIVYEEHPMSWTPKDTEQTVELFHESVTEALLRCRNYVSFGIFGMLNETEDSEETAVRFDAAVNELVAAREIAPNTLFMLGSGRWDGHMELGSASNPGSTTWDGYMGNEAADMTVVSRDEAYEDAWMNGMGDVHYYPHFPIDNDARTTFEEIADTAKAVFLSEFGMGSQVNIIRSYLLFDQEDIVKAAWDVGGLKQKVSDLRTFYKNYGLDKIWATAEDVLRATEEYQSSQRAYEWTMVRRVDGFNGFSTTMAFDCGFKGEGILDANNSAKIDMTETLQEAMNDLRFCITAEDSHIWSGEDLHLEVVISDFDVLKDMDYPVTVRVIGDEGTLWEKTVTVRPGEGTVIPVVDEMISTEGWASGTYTIGAEMLEGADPTCGTAKFYVTNQSEIARVDGVVYAYAADVSLLEAYGATVVTYEPGMDIGTSTLFVGRARFSDELQAAIYDAVEHGAHVVFLSYRPQGITLPFAYECTLVEFSNWLYHVDNIVFENDITKGLQAGGIWEAEYYNDVYSDYFIVSTDAPTDVSVATFTTGIEVCSDYEGFLGGYQLGTFAYGEGYITLNTLELSKSADSPVTATILCNLANYTKAN